MMAARFSLSVAGEPDYCTNDAHYEYEGNGVVGNAKV